MPENIVWQRETPRCIIQIVATWNWKRGKPINPKIQKWLVKITDKWLQDEYFPHDKEFALIVNWLDEESLEVISEAFRLKEQHNRANLKNPESRANEQIFGRFAD